MLYNCRETFTDVMSALQNHLFMQNKANFRKVKLNVNKVLTKDYEIMDTWSSGKNEPKTNPIKANKTPKRTQNKAKQTQFQTRFTLCEFFLFFTSLYPGYNLPMQNCGGPSGGLFVCWLRNRCLLFINIPKC